MRRGIVSLIGALALAVPASASAIDYAPVDRPGPPLSVPQEALDAALACSSNLDDASKTPVLLVPGTGSNPEHNFSWNWVPALDELGVPWCTVALPHNALGDIQIAGEYVVNGIRSMQARAGRKISILGHSQGGMLPRWAFRFWPDTRAMVDDKIGLAASNHGSLGGSVACALGCPEAVWQQDAGSAFIKALNSYQETFPGISYTEIYTRTDWVVTPNFDDSGSSSVHGGGGEIENVAIQEVCPLDLTEHNALGTVSNVGYALAVDALTHPGPANPARIDSSVCLQPFMPTVRTPTRVVDAAAAIADTIANFETAQGVPAEPPLRCYVTASCPETAVPAGARTKTKAKCRRKKGKARAAAKKKPACKPKRKRSRG